MSAPEFMICLNCETPCYVFEWVDGEVTEAMCTACLNEDPEQFATEEEYESLSGGQDRKGKDD